VIALEMMAMLLAGGEGKRLGVLTREVAKPAVHFGGKYRIIDFTLSNCMHSGINTVGVLTQYQPFVLNQYLGIGSPWGLDRRHGGMHILPPYMKSKGGTWYSGTANAIYQNIGFIERYNPEYVLIISGDHIYKMDYDKMLKHHIEKGADATIAVLEVDWEEASRFGLIISDENGRITSFQEKPKNPASNLASMGVYIFSWPVLKKYLLEDEMDKTSENDFGKNVIPAMLADRIKLFTYAFKGYWKDVGTIESLWEANMDLISVNPQLDLNDKARRVFSVNPNRPAQYIAPDAQIVSSLITEGCFVGGMVYRSVLFHGVEVSSEAIIKESVIMPGVKIGKGAHIYKAIIGEGAVIEEGVTIGSEGSSSITVVSSDERVSYDGQDKEVEA
jgi:glucose-1-phosphate adenylyltransferase